MPMEQVHAACYARQKLIFPYFRGSDGLHSCRTKGRPPAASHRQVTMETRRCSASLNVGRFSGSRDQQASINAT